MQKIDCLSARVVSDSRGENTIAVTVRLEGGAEAEASVPQGKSTGSHEAAYVSAEKAVANVEGEIADAVRGFDALNQEALDARLCEIDGTERKERLGANAILGVSLATARAAARAAEKELWQHLRDTYGGTAPKTTPELYPHTRFNNVASEATRAERIVKTGVGVYLNLINGGLHAEAGPDFQEYLIIPEEASVKESLASGSAFFEALKRHAEERYGDIAVGDEGGIVIKTSDRTEPLELFEAVREELAAPFSYGIDAAASSISESHEKLTRLYKHLSKDYPLTYLEDPFAEESFEQFAELTKEIGDKITIAGDDITATNTKRMEKAKESGSVNGVIIKPNQVGTLSETFAAIRFAQENRWKVIISHRSGETEDDFISDLAWAVGADGLKAGAPEPKERMAKYNRLSTISEGRSF